VQSGLPPICLHAYDLQSRYIIYIHSQVYAPHKVAALHLDTSHLGLILDDYFHEVFMSLMYESLIIFLNKDLNKIIT